MSTALSNPAVLGAAPTGPPGYWQVFRSALPALIVSTLLLWVLALVLYALRLTPFDGSNGSELAIYEPWVVDGAWALAAALAWGLLVAALVAFFLRERLEARTGLLVSPLLTVASVAIAGYGPWLVTDSSKGRVLLDGARAPGHPASARLRAVRLRAAASPRDPADGATCRVAADGRGTPADCAVCAAAPGRDRRQRIGRRERGDGRLRHALHAAPRAVARRRRL